LKETAKIEIKTPVVSAEWLNTHLQAENLLLFDATIPKVVGNTSELSEVQLPRTQFFDIKKAFSDLSGEFPSTIPSEAQFQAEARKLGVNNDSAIVVYDDKGIYSSARVWWLFKVFGYKNVAILNGGLPEWRKQGFKTEPKQNNLKPLGSFEAHFKQEYVVYFKDLDTLSKDTNTLILDARASGRFNCEVPEPRAGLRSGTIPNSESLPFANCLENGILKDKNQLQNIFYTLVPDTNTNLIFTCGSGITACVLDLAATIADYKNTRVYDGSWTEYGSLTP
jgi:thiosulfate/3-mercaptopyruvate sulfurtransferase